MNLRIPIHLLPLLLLVLVRPVTAQVQQLQLWWADIGETDSTCLGHGIVRLGDINFDGLSDFVVGSSAARAYVYYGNPEPDTIPDLVIICPDSDIVDFTPVANIGDVNCDGWDDILIQGANYAPWIDILRVYLYYGGEAFDSLPDMVFQGIEG